jgi:dihydroxyacid dehydratase/phosphogluconate dehydratase
MAWGSMAQFAGGTPAMCDGVTQGQPGMELSLFSRDTIAMSTAVSLSHNMFDATLLPGSAFVNPGTPLREQLTRVSTEQVIRLSKPQGGTLGLDDMVDEKSIVNALVALLVTGGSTNLTLHWVAIARAASVIIDWNDYAELLSVVPSMTRIYPNGEADINAFHDAGGTPF